MQRRVAAIYFAFFLVMGASAFSVMAVAEEPAVDIPGNTYAQNDTFRVSGERYTVTKLGVAEGGGGGHGGGGGASYAGTLTQTNESSRYTAALANNSTIVYQGDDYRVVIANESDVDSFTLREEQNVTAILRADPAVYNETSRIDGQRYVTFRENNTNRLLSAYLPTPASERFSVGDPLQYQSNSTTVVDVTPAEATVEWFAPRTTTRELTQGGNVTLSGETYLVHFTGDKHHPEEIRILLSQDFQGYNDALATQDYYHERINGLWGVIILSGVAAFLILAMAYMPVRG